MNWKYCILLLLVFSFCILGSDSVYAGNLTGSWNGTVTGGGTGAVIKSSAGNITVTGKVTTTGNARWGPTDPGVPGSVGFSNGSFNTVNFWSNSSAAGHRSLQSTYWWDINPEAVGTDIDRSGDDKGTGYITFYFSKPVLNPVLHIDRIGGDGHITSTYIITNSALFTLVNPNLSLTKLSGNNQFRVTSKTIERTPDQVYSSITQNATWSSNSAAAGSVRINGVVSSVTFKWTGVGIESEGHDGLELIWELTDDSTPPTINATVTPNLTKTGRILTIKATSSSDTKTLTATILGKTYNLVKGSGNTWTLRFTVPKVSSGKYNIYLTATDLVGNKGKFTLNFTVDNTPPVIKASLTPKLTKTGNVITIKATASSDTKTLTATILRKTYNMVKGTGGVWTLKYTVPRASSGTYSAFLTATDRVGNKGKSTLKFTVDNTPPAVVGAFIPSLTKSGNNITLKAVADSDTKTLTATIFGKKYNMIKGTKGIWILKYTVPNVSNGNYNALLTAIDHVGNRGSAKVGFTVYNPVAGLSTMNNNLPYNSQSGSANTLSKSNCGPVALSNSLNGLGIKADASTIASLAGTNKQGTSFYGLVQAAKRFGLNLTGLKLKYNQLQAGDMVLLKLKGVNHYSSILAINNDGVILSDPTHGIIVISKADFLKIYTGYALTSNPNGRGVPLSVNEMKNLKGSFLPLIIAGIALISSDAAVAAAVGVCAGVVAGVIIRYGDSIWNGLTNRRRGSTRSSSRHTNPRKLSNGYRITRRRHRKHKFRYPKHLPKLRYPKHLPKLRYPKHLPKLRHPHLPKLGYPLETVEAGKKSKAKNKNNRNKNKEISPFAGYYRDGPPPKGLKLLIALATVGFMGYLLTISDTLGKAARYGNNSSTNKTSNQTSNKTKIEAIISYLKRGK